MFLLAALCVALPRSFAHETRDETELLSESLNRVETLQLEVMSLREKNERLRRSLARMKTRVRKLSGDMRKLSREMRKMRAESRRAEGVASRKPSANNGSESRRRVVAPASTSRVTVAPRSADSDSGSATVPRPVSAPASRPASQPQESPSWVENPLGAIKDLFVGKQSGEANEKTIATTTTARDNEPDATRDAPPSMTTAEPSPPEAQENAPRVSDDLADTQTDVESSAEIDAEGRAEVNADTDAGGDADAGFEEGIVYGALSSDRASAQYERAMEWLDRNEPERFKIAMREWLDQHGTTDSALQADALYWLAETYYADENWPQARHYYTRLVKNFPKSARRDGARLKLAYLLHREKHYAAAEEVLRELLQSDDSRIRRLAQARLTRVQKDSR